MPAFDVGIRCLLHPRLSIRVGAQCIFRNHSILLLSNIIATHFPSSDEVHLAQCHARHAGVEDLGRQIKLGIACAHSSVSQQSQSMRLRAHGMLEVPFLGRALRPLMGFERKQISLGGACGRKYDITDREAMIVM